MASSLSLKFDRARNLRRIRRKLVKRGKCAYCGCRVTVKKSTLDHVLPTSRGGDDSPASLVLAGLVAELSAERALAASSGTQPA
jgi:5-methylcytosine-specific restriction endonuclease McrA